MTSPPPVTEPARPGSAATGPRAVSLVEIAAAVPIEALPPGSGRRLWERVYRARIRAGREVCRHCGAPARPGVPLTLDHLRAVSQGGATTLANSTILCRACNGAKGAESWPHLHSLASEEESAPPQRQWARLAGIQQLRAAGNAWCVDGVDRGEVTLTRSARRGAVCVRCRLTPGRGPVLIGHAPADALAHLSAHRAAGHHVPRWADDLITTVTGTGHAA